MQENNKYKICIFSPLENAYSETFIKNHINNLPFNIQVVNGTSLDNASFNGKMLLGNSVVVKIFARMFKSKNACAFFLLKRKLEMLKPDLVLFEYGHIGVNFYKICLILNIPFIVHFHGNDASHTDTINLLGDHYRQMFSKASAVIGVSRSMIERLISLGATKDKLHNIPYGVDLNFFQKNSKQVNLEKKIIVGVGRFVEKKAPHITILAFSKIINKHPNAELIFAGDGPLLNPCKQLVRALKMESCVKFLGIQSPVQIAGLLNCAYLFVQHSVIDEDGGAEGAPNSIIESSGSGVPVVSTRHEGIPDIVLDGVTGILVEEFDIEKMSIAIDEILSNGELHEKMSSAGVLRIKSDFNLDVQIKKLAALVEDIILLNERR